MKGGGLRNMILSNQQFMTPLLEEVLRRIKKFRILLICNEIKKLSFCHKLKFSNLYIFVTQYRRPVDCCFIQL